MNKVLSLFFGCRFQKPFHTVVGFTVPPELFFRQVRFISSFKKSYNLFDIVDLVVNNLFLQIGIADICVGMVDNIHFFYLLSHKHPP